LRNAAVLQITPPLLLVTSDSSPATARTQNEPSRQSRDAAMYREGEATQSILILIVEDQAYVSLSWNREPTGKTEEGELESHEMTSVHKQPSKQSA
jgi:hypothetical protein